jgi:uncharacterized protein (TIGR02118 family)
MNKLMVIFHTPPNIMEFEENWSERFVSKAEKMPDLKGVSVTRVYGGPAGEVNIHLIHEFYFEDAQSIRRAMVSPEGQEAGQELLSFAVDYVTICFGEHLEEARS